MSMKDDPKEAYGQGVADGFNMEVSRVIKDRTKGCSATTAPAYLEGVNYGLELRGQVGAHQHETRKLVHREALLQNIADGVSQLQSRGSTMLHSVGVKLYDEEGLEVCSASLGTILDYIVNDTYWDEGGNWSQATRAEVDVE